MCFATGQLPDRAVLTDRAHGKWVYLDFRRPRLTWSMVLHLQRKDQGMSENKCPVCESVLIKSEDRLDYVYFECARCGPYALSDEALVVLRLAVSRDKRVRTKVSHSIRKMFRAGEWPQFTEGLIRNILGTTDLPTPSEQFDNLIVWLGSTQVDAGARMDAQEQTISSVGSTDYNGLGFIVSEARRAGFVDCEVKFIKGVNDAGGCVISPMQLTMAGWQRFENLRRGRSNSRVAFMAMPFGVDELDTLYREQFQPAVAATGFTLKRLDEGQPAGLIDDRMRVEIRQSRFLISDLTHGNAGAYWEAGYAEGLGKPVIYTCRNDVFDDKKKGTHFDTNHHLTVVWDPSHLEQATRRLKDTIRATLPTDAVLTD
jgi:hypothetical protein